MADRLTDFTHPALNEQVDAIGGSYILTDEFRIPMDGEELLYFTGVAIVDRSCCGVGGCAYAFVPGFVVEWHYKTGDTGRPVSRIRPVDDETLRERVSALIHRNHTVQQIQFL